MRIVRRSCLAMIYAAQKANATPPQMRTPRKRMCMVTELKKNRMSVHLFVRPLVPALGFACICDSAKRVACLPCTLPIRLESAITSTLAASVVVIATVGAEAGKGILKYKITLAWAETDR